MIKDIQVIALKREYRKYKQTKIAALKTGMNRKTAAKYLKSQKLPSEVKKDRNWRTHEDKILSVWDESLEILDSAPDIQAKALFEYLLDQHPDRIQESQLRSFQRKVKQWRILNGSLKEVYFDQIAIPGEMAQVDWVDMNMLKILINGEHYKHKFIHFTLNYSNTESMTICKSESVLSIKKGLKKFLYDILGKAPQVLQIDNSSAATHTLNDSKERVFNDEYLEILKYYNITPQKNNVRKPNENGVVESLNGNIKNRIEQNLKIRGNRDFKTVKEYTEFVDNIISKLNSRRSKKFKEELPSLKSIPQIPLPEYQERYVTVRNRSCVYIKNKTYSVPSRLIGTKLKAKIYEDKIELHSGMDMVYSFRRALGSREVIINYRHIIHSLIKKPRAFEHYRYRSELFPTDNFRNIYDHLTDNKNLSKRSANLEYLRILKLAADNSEEDVDIAISLILTSNSHPANSETITNLIQNKPLREFDNIKFTPDLETYDDLLSTVQ